MQQKILLVAAAIMCCTMSFAKTPQRPESYNYQRGIELLNSDQIDEGIKFLEKELDQNPKNGYADAWLAVAYAEKDEMGIALHFLEEAIKHLPKSDKYYRAWAHSVKGHFYLEMSDTTQAISCFTQAIKIEPQNEEWYEYRGFLYRDMKQWDKSDSDFRQYLKLTNDLTRGYIYLGRNLFLQERYEEALEQYQYAHKLAERAFTYSAMAEVEVKLGNYEAAANHIIESLKMEPGEDKCMEIITNSKDAAFIELLLQKSHAQALANPNAIDWYFYTMHIQRAQKDYEGAIRSCQKLQTISPDVFFDDFMADLYGDMGDWNNALKFRNKTLESDSTNVKFRYLRAYIYSEMDSIAQVYSDIDYLLKLYPDEANFYFARASFNLFLQNYENAIEDYNNGMAFEDSNDWERYMRGRCYEANGQLDNAHKDYLYVESNTKKPEVLMFAKASLGKPEEAMALADSLLKADTTEYRYNVACVYALLGEKELALLELEKEMKAGYVRFTHLRRDPDLQSLPGNELELLIQKYEAITKERIEKFKEVEQTNQSEERIVEIPFTTSISLPS